jgi:predicted esterase
VYFDFRKMTFYFTYTLEEPMKHYFIVYIIFFSIFYTDQSKSASTPLNINYIESRPVIDGRLDKRLSDLKFNEFDYYNDFGDPVDNEIKVRFKLAYNKEFFYVYIETDADKISFNKRGYLYGDGFKIILGQLTNGSVTEEYYDLAYSPNSDKTSLDRQFIMTYNTQHISKALSVKSETNELAQTSKTGFETIISWDDIHPINPLFNGDIGLNIYFAKNISAKDTVGYSIKHDESIWDEEVLSRNLAQVNFISPASRVKSAQIFRTNYSYNENIQIKTYQMDSNDFIIVTVTDSKGLQRINQQLSHLKSTQKVVNHSINSEKLEPGLYAIKVYVNGMITEDRSLSISNNIPFHKVKNKLITKMNDINKGATSTLQFHINDAEKMLAQLKPYETAVEFNKKWNSFSQLLNIYVNGKNPFADNYGPYRKAFKSKIDQTYQPYSIKLPNNYDVNKKYPLLVFLHGSGRDEQGLLSNERANGEFIELAPLGRDMFRAFAMPDSQIDIVEAIDDVKKYFSIDDEKIIIGGFSMGGYGALRTYYENPNIYQGVAVFAGHPDLANQWGVTGTHPNFLDNKFTKVFKKTPVFIYHGTNDEALSFKSIQQLKATLQEAGAKVTSSFVEGRGHRYQDKNTNKIYHQWLEQFMQ